MRRRRPSFASDARGAAAVEFALIAPIFALAVVIIGDGASLVLHYYDMRAAVSSAAQYVMEKGTNASLSTAQSVALSAWNTRPDRGTVSVSNACICGTSASACNVLCSDQSVPKSYTTIQATSAYAGAVINQTLTASQVVRVR